MLPTRLLCNIAHEPFIALRGLNSVSNEHFRFYNDFLNMDEQRILLAACLQKLDDQESPRVRRNRRRMLAERSNKRYENTDELLGLFAPEESCEFEKVRNVLLLELAFDLT